MAVHSTVDAIEASSRQHAELVCGINELDYAKPALERCSAYLQDLQTQRAYSEADLTRLSESTEKEHAEHIHLRKSIARKWTSKLVGKGEQFQKKVTQEEKVYLEALEHEHGARGKHEKLLSDLNEAEKNIRSLREACNLKDRLQAELDALYERVFAGSTPDFPQEDEYEDRVSTTEAANYQAQSEYTQEAQTLAVLNQADEALKNCLNFIKQAKEWSTHDVWGGGFKVDCSESEMLMSAQTAASQFSSHMAHARRMNGAVPDVLVPVMPKQSTMDLYFNTFFDDLAMRNKIQAAVVDVEKARSAFNQIHKGARRRVENTAYQAAITSSATAQARHELHDLRVAMFTNVLNGGGTEPLPAAQEGGAPPPFSVRDRAPPTFPSVGSPSPGLSSSPAAGASQDTASPAVLPAPIHASRVILASNNPYATLLSAGRR